jgi:hypothetical protein
MRRNTLLLLACVLGLTALALVQLPHSTYDLPRARSVRPADATGVRASGERPVLAASGDAGARSTPVTSTPRTAARTGPPERAVSASGESPALPELPRDSVDVSMPRLSGRVIRVGARSDLQAALDAARGGDVVELEAGATWHGAFRLAGDRGGVVVVRSSRAAELPAGRRVSPADAPKMARLVGGEGNRPVLEAARGAVGWRLVGLEITVNPDPGSVPKLITAVVAQQSGSSNLVFDRTYIHSTPRQGVQRCLALNGARAAVIESYLDECHAKGFDSQAIEGWKGPGPYLIRNNYLAGAGENIMFGGAAIGNGEIPSDIVIRGNLVYKPDAWRVGRIWSVKNLLELKMAQRLLIEDNVFSGNWAESQDGFAIVIKSENRDKKRHPEWATTDVTFRRNRILDSPKGLNITGAASTKRVSGTGRTARLLFEDVEMPLKGKSQRAFQMMGGLQDVTIRRVRTNGRVALEPGGVRGLRIEESCFSWVLGSGLRQGRVVLDERAPGWIFRQNTVTDVRSPREYPQGDGNVYSRQGSCPEK